MNTCDTLFALLDDSDATPARPTSRLYTGFVREHRCTDPATLDATCAAVQADLAAGLHARAAGRLRMGRQADARRACRARRRDDRSACAC